MKSAANSILVAPSLLSCDFTRLKEEIGEVERAGCDWLHLDVMDGHFVPNLTIGPVVVSWIRKCTRLPLDVHLMIENPEQYVEAFRKAGADWMTVHIEACPEPGATLSAIRKSGAKAGLSVRPKTPIETIFPFLKEVDLVLVMTVEPGFGGQAFMPEMLEKVRRLRPRFQGLISVDGGIDPRNAPGAVQAGANILVAGSALFGQKDRARALQDLRASSRSAASAGR
ncbi:MAG: ribulose-phosphate 3-epimerase [Candidatus Omnitrophica bacterium]|nr:ribulose-phosphate 3-epimerase [Candidatus Omnitrophota bacterium]